MIKKIDKLIIKQTIDLLNLLILINLSAINSHKKNTDIVTNKKMYDKIFLKYKKNRTLMWNKFEFLSDKFTKNIFLLFDNDLKNNTQNLLYLNNLFEKHNETYKSNTFYDELMWQNFLYQSDYKKFMTYLEKIKLNKKIVYFKEEKQNISNKI